ncbi:hypothetical protein B0I35DRAFT_428677 [Stachybotrys elegans]|uniref:HECT-type E3 ubiquitin transferase n=1 Tax=Stachybotrys elegans TaxID=80388 RepID=A0A8K0SUF8_9HYPO|nr:hypothetical protein B0I35DRAFT_428677 [Stachybotrys elegans]
MAPSGFHRDRRPVADGVFNHIHNGVFATSAPSSRTEPSSRSISNTYSNNRNFGSPSRDQQISQPQPVRPVHSRSMSHPFPALLGGKKKEQASSSALTLDLDWVDDDGKISKKQTSRTHTRAGLSAGSKDFITGNCMTCASLVRWPKDLKVFKCTICSTVNDLVPLPIADQDAESQRRDHTRQASFGVVHGKASPLSLGHTKHLVHQCLSAYISRRLSSKHVKRAETTPVPPGGHMPKSDAAGRGYTLPIRSNQEPIGSQGSAGYVPRFVFDEEPTLHKSPVASSPNSRFSPSTHPASARPANPSNNALKQPPPTPLSAEDEARRIFKPLEDYIVSCLNSFESINNAFLSHNGRAPMRNGCEAVRRKPVASRDNANQPKPSVHDPTSTSTGFAGFDAKMLLVGDFAENGTWWTGGQGNMVNSRSVSQPPDHGATTTTPSKSPQINWAELSEWYMTVLNVAEGWFRVYEEQSQDPTCSPLAQRELQGLERTLLLAQEHIQRVLLKAIEVMLKRPGRPMSEPGDLRFLLLMLENPLLQSEPRFFRGLLQPDVDPRPASRAPLQRNTSGPKSGPMSGQHSGVIKRIIGLISNSSAECHNQLTVWFARYPADRFVQAKDLVSGFLSYRVLRMNEKKQDTKVDITAGLIPLMPTGRSGASLHDEIGASSSSKKSKEAIKKTPYADDWQIKAASRVLALMFAANNMAAGRRTSEALPVPTDTRWNPQPLPTSDFYNSMIDYIDLVGDFEAWESKKAKFTFCQYPFLLSIWAKTQILEHDAKRQMEMKARDAWFENIMNNKNATQFLSLSVRRDCLVEDSLTTVSEVIGSGGEDLKKRLRITFSGEEGIDAGGLRKEWFLLLVRDVFNPEHGMFVFDEDSQCCYFNPNSFENSDQFYLVGIVMGLAIYNSTIIDVALPPVAFRKLLASAPSHSLAPSSHPRPVLRYTLEDLAEFRPRLARGLKQLLDYDGDVEKTFSLDFVVEVDKYGTTTSVPLCPGGERKPVTNHNRREYVDLYVRYILDVSVTRQFEPFKRGFYTVCGGNAFSLFRPEEIELLVRGSDESLDISSLRAVAQYDNWGTPKPDGQEPVVSWFWETFHQASPGDQRRMLLFITGSDRIPAMGATTLSIKLSCLGDDCGRFPIARTCFNLLSLWRYKSKERLEAMLWRAVMESEGFGLK